MHLYERLIEVQRNGQQAALATIIRSSGSVPRHEGSKMLVFPDGSIEGTIGGGELENRVIEEAILAIREGKARKLDYKFNDPEKGDPGVCGGQMEVFVEPILPKPTVLIVGAGHVGSAVAHLASWLGFRVVASDDRPRFATPEAVPEAEEIIHCELAELPKRVAINSQTYLVLTTRGFDVDVAGLPQLLDTPAAYIGVIGSRRRWQTCVAQLLQSGVPEGKIARVASPIGLELNAETPEEIALSIMSQIIMLRRGGSGKSMAHPAGGRRKHQGAR